MNCKQGDLAVFVRSKAGNEGKVVTCLRLARWDEINEARFAHDAGPIWKIDRAVPTLFPYGNDIRFADLAHDSMLRPIRDPGDDATDEMIVLLGKPVREGETV
jgi:hypothetical protein